MKKFIYIFMISLLAASCGQKGESSKAKFKIFSGNLEGTAAQAAFPGGLMVMGRSADGTQSFKLVYQPGLELELKKGPWEFATIGWLGSSPITGRQKCSYQRVDINTDIFTVSFLMNQESCKATFGNFERNQFTEPRFYKDGFGLKKLTVGICPPSTPFEDCSTTVSPTSYRVGIVTDLKGIVANSTIGPGLDSGCLNSQSNPTTPPYGGNQGFIDTYITTFASSSCGGEPKKYFFRHGFGLALDKTYTDATNSQVSRRGILLFDAGITSITSNPVAVALAPINEYMMATTITNNGLYHIPVAGTFYYTASASASTSTTQSFAVAAEDHVFCKPDSAYISCSVLTSDSVKLFLQE